MKQNSHLKCLFLCAVMYMFACTSMYGHSTERQTHPLSEVLDQISNRYQVIITYNPKLLFDINIDFELRDEEDMKSAVNRALEKTNLKYKQLTDKYYIVFHETKTSRKTLKKLKKKFREIEKLEQQESLSIQKINQVKEIHLDNVIREAQKLVEITSISGYVHDTEGEPLVGATILVKGTTVGTIADVDGAFSLSVPNGATTLVFSYIGYISQEVEIDGRNLFDIRLAADATTLDEVLVVGYGTQSKRYLTDNVIKYNNESFANVPTPNLINALVGKGAGIQINQLGGKVEGSIGIRIRGQASISAGTNPLFILDGIPLTNIDESTSRAPTNPLLTLSPSEIESIEVLKDASAAAIYGSRGANGVVVITTKEGKEGKPSISLNMSYGTSEVINTLDFLNAAQYVELISEAGENVGQLEAAEAGFDRISQGTDWRNGEVDTDWEEFSYQRGYTRDVDLSISGGSAKTKYFLSGAYNKTKGILVSNGLERISARSNIKHKISDKIKTGINLSFSRVDIGKVDADNSFTNPLFSTMQPRIAPAFTPEGETIANPFFHSLAHALQNTSDKALISRFIGKAYGEYQILPDLKFNSSFAFDFFTSTEDRWRGRLSAFNATNGEVFTSNANTENYIVSNYLTINKELNEIHRIAAVIGTEFNNSERTFTSVTGTQFPSDDFRLISSAAEIAAGSGDVSEYNFVSYFARATYAINDKYLFKASFRRDGSSRFGTETRFGSFPSVSAGWIISDEDFLEGLEKISFLKLRASWGKVGNAEIGDFASRSLYSGVSYVGNSGLAPTQAGNNSLGWESSTQLELALEYGLFNNRITGDIAYYTKNTNDLLFNEPIIPSAGDPDGQGVTKNIGRLDSKGIEISIQTQNIQNNDFSWTTNFNIANNTNEIASLPNGADVINGQNILREGLPVNSFYLIEYAGVDPDNGDALWYTNTDNSDGTIDRTKTNNSSAASRIIAGNKNPDWIAGITNTLNYKNFDFSATFNGEWGANIYRSGARFYAASGSFLFYGQTTDQLDRWQKPGDITDVPQARLNGFHGNDHSTRYLETGNFIRLRNVTLGYTLPQGLASKIGVSSLGLYVTGHNLLTITNFEGTDVESRTTEDIDSSVNSNALWSAPLAKTYSFGVNIKF